MVISRNGARFDGFFIDGQKSGEPNRKARPFVTRERVFFSILKPNLASFSLHLESLQQQNQDRDLNLLESRSRNTDHMSEIERSR